MEPGIRAFLVLVMQSVSVTLLWMLINMTAGIYFNLGFFEGRPSAWNIGYYFFFIVTFWLLIKYLRKRWKGFKEVDE